MSNLSGWENLAYSSSYRLITELHSYYSGCVLEEAEVEIPHEDPHRGGARDLSHLWKGTLKLNWRGKDKEKEKVNSRRCSRILTRSMSI